jgi:hypothetical protein
MKFNAGFSAEEIADMERQIKATGHQFVYADKENSNDEYAEIHFIGLYKGHPVIFDAAIYTLPFAYENELYEMAEARALEKYPDFYEGNSAGISEDDFEDYLALMMAEIEEEELVKVSEKLEYDETFEYGVGLEVCINELQLDAKTIDKFISRFNNNQFVPDPTLYSFEMDEEDDEE